MIAQSLAFSVGLIVLVALAFVGIAIWAHSDLSRFAVVHPAPGEQFLVPAVDRTSLAEIVDEEERYVVERFNCGVSVICFKAHPSAVPDYAVRYRGRRLLGTRNVQEALAFARGFAAGSRETQREMDTVETEV